MPRFYLIDGHAQIYRAYYSPYRDLTSPDGKPVKAVFSFCSMLLGLIASQKPDYLAMVVDATDDAELHRAQIYPAYKANRPPRPDDFTPQEQRILQIVRDAGIPIYQLPGYEADDVLASLARQLESQGFDVVLVSRDKDLYQVLSEHISMFDLRDGQPTFLTPQTLQDQLGFTPQQAVDIQSLMGDKIDNVPGIPGVGEKTALELIRQFGSAQAVIDHADEIKRPKLRESVKAFAAQLPVTRQLVTLSTDLTIPGFSADDCRFRGLRTDALARHFRELGFNSLLGRLARSETPNVEGAPPPDVVRRSPGPSPGLPPTGDGLFDHLAGSGSTQAAATPSASSDAPPAAPDTDALDPRTFETSAGLPYQLVNTPDGLARLVEQLRQQTRIAIDTETDGLGAMNAEPIGFSFSWAPGTGHYVAVKGPPGAQVLPLHDVVAALRPVLEDPAIAKVGHNVKYDLLVYRNCGVRVRGLAMDTMVAAFILDASRLQYGIDRLAEQLLGFKKIPTTALIGSGKDQRSMAAVDLQTVAHYAAEDADICLRLARLFDEQLERFPTLRKLCEDVETPLVEVLAEMEFNGIAVDPAVLQDQSAVLGQRIAELRQRILDAAGVAFNPDSPKQLAEVLFNHLGLKSVRKTKTGHSTDVEVLERLADEHPVPRLILEYRSLQKLKNTYLDTLTQYISPRTGRIHTHFNPTGAATGRLSSSDPNLQNIPIRTDEGRRIRLAFIPSRPEHVLLSADYSQIELRILAHLAEEPALIRAFQNDEDIHAAVAAEVFGVPLGEVTREQRSQAKTINFGIIYGVTAYGLSRRIENLSTSAADRLIKDYNARFPAIRRFLHQCVEFARTHGYVETLLGRRRPLPDIHSHTLTVRNAAERMAINSVVQGSAADLIKLAMLRIHRRLTAENRPARMLLQVHDELVFETPRTAAEQDAALVREEMTSAMNLAVPLKVDIGWGDNWGEVK
ncbi:MAG: DNA polymerase I [Tepidisphaerales bacterium]